MNNIKCFVTDATKTLLYFATTPLQFLFFHMPRVYEATIKIILCVQSLVPSKTELLLTCTHWQLNASDCLFYIYKSLISACIKSNNTLIQYKKKKLLHYDLLGQQMHKEDMR